MDQTKNIEIVSRDSIENFPVVYIAGHDEPLIEEKELSAKLGYANPDDIRQIIVSIWGKPTAKGFPLLQGKPATSTKGGRPTAPIFLTERQALKVVMRSRTATADAVQDQVITVYMAWRRGKLTGPAQGGGVLAGQLQDLTREMRRLNERQHAIEQVITARVPLLPAPGPLTAESAAKIGGQIRQLAKHHTLSFQRAEGILREKFVVPGYLRLREDQAVEAILFLAGEIAKPARDPEVEHQEAITAAAMKLPGEDTTTKKPRRLKLVKNG